MKKYTLYIILLAAQLLCAASAGAQTEVFRFVPGLTSDGLMYYLPKTEFMIGVTAKRTTKYPGDFWKYASRFLRLGNVTEAVQTQWEVTDVQLLNTARPDTAKAYVVLVRKGTSAPLCSLTDDGILLSVNAQASKPVAPTLENKKGTTTTKLNSREYFTAEMLGAASEQKLAQLTAQKILEIRATREALAAGTAPNAPQSADQLNSMLAELKNKEAAMTQLFTGYEETETLTTFFTYAPTVAGRAVLAKLSATSGVVNASSQDGFPIYMDVMNLQTVPAGVTTIPDPKIVAHSLRYNIPSQAVVVISMEGHELLRKQFPVAQFGRVEYLTEDLFNRRSTCHLWFNPLTGNLDNIQDDGIKK